MWPWLRYDDHRTTGALSDELRAHAEWNATFAPLYVGTHALFDGLQAAKERFRMVGTESPPCPHADPERGARTGGHTYAEIVVSGFVRACTHHQTWCWTCVHAMALWRLRRANSRRSPVDACVRARFYRAVRRPELADERARARALVAQANDWTPTQLVARLVDVFLPTLFQCTVTTAFGDLCEWTQVVRALIAETDRVIQADLRFREGLMDNARGHLAVE